MKRPVRPPSFFRPPGTANGGLARAIHRALNAVLPQALRRRFRSLAGFIIPSLRHLDMPSRMARLRDLGFQPAVILDVGASDGEWARIAGRVWPEARIIGFEPNRSRIPDLEQLALDQPRFSFHRAFLGSAEGTITYEDRGVETSLFAAVGDRAALETAEMLVLDALVARGDVPQPAMMKLDVQGYELEVLRGAEATLANCELILTEVIIAPILPGVPLIHDVVRFMADRGFVCFDIQGILRRESDDALVALDLVFVPESHWLRPGPT